MRRYTKSANFALVGSALFTLSGWGVYNIFFNHFIDCMVLFPFLLAALDSYIYDKQRAVLPLAIALNPVSYTHLDVYKRQPYSLGLAQSACLCSVPFGAARGGAWGGRKMQAFGFVPFGGPVPWGLRRA